MYSDGSPTSSALLRRPSLRHNQTRAPSLLSYLVHEYVRRRKTSELCVVCGRSSPSGTRPSTPHLAACSRPPRPRCATPSLRGHNFHSAHAPAFSQRPMRWLLGRKRTSRAPEMFPVSASLRLQTLHHSAHAASLFLLPFGGLRPDQRCQNCPNK